MGVVYPYACEICDNCALLCWKIENFFENATQRRDPCLKRRRMSIKMKKTYDKPRLFCEELHPETMLCGCDVRNPNFSDLEMCNYTFEVEDSFATFVIFGENWTGCETNNEDLVGTEYYFCYFGPATSIFSS